MLEPLNILPADEQLYRELLRHPDRTLAELAEATGGDGKRLRRQLRALEAHGLVTRTPTRPARFRPAQPDLALEVLALRRHQEIERARLAAAELTELFRAAAGLHEAIPVDVIAGSAANVQRFLQTQRATRDEVLIFDKPPYVMEGVVSQTDVQLELMARGVRYRTIYDRASLAEPSQLALARRLAAAGEQARVLDEVPMKMQISDRSIALVPFALSAERQTLVIQNSPLMDGLIALFELLWDRAVPLWPSGSPASSGLTSEDAELLGYAAVGYTDEAVARKLGVNTRTVERRMRRVMDILGARTRFQAGLQAARKGVLGA